MGQTQLPCYLPMNLAIYMEQPPKAVLATWELYLESQVQTLSYQNQPPQECLQQVSCCSLNAIESEKFQDLSLARHSKGVNYIFNRNASPDHSNGSGVYILRGLILALHSLHAPTTS